MTHHPEPGPPVIVCHDEASDLLPFADLQDQFRSEPVTLADLRRALADMRARFTGRGRLEGS